MPGARCTRSLACNEESTRASHRRFTGNHPHSRTRWFLTVSFELSPVTGLFCHVIGEITSANLAPASGRQDHTTSPSALAALVFAPLSRPSHPAPTSVTIAKTPPLGTGWRELWM